MNINQSIDVSTLRTQVELWAQSDWRRGCQCMKDWWLCGGVVISPKWVLSLRVHSEGRGGGATDGIVCVLVLLMLCCIVCGLLSWPSLPASLWSIECTLPALAATPLQQAWWLGILYFIRVPFIQKLFFQEGNHTLSRNYTLSRVFFLLRVWEEGNHTLKCIMYSPLFKPQFLYGHAECAKLEDWSDGLLNFTFSSDLWPNLFSHTLL